MLVVSALVAYVIVCIRASFCMLMILASTFVALWPLGIRPNEVVSQPEYLVYGALFFGTFVPLVYIVIDAMFGITVKSVGRESLSFDVHKLPSMSWLAEIMWTVSDLFNTEIRLYIEKSDKFRIYSMGSIRLKRVYISIPLITYLSGKTATPVERNRIVGALISAEVSKLANYYFLPKMIIRGSDNLAKLLCIIATLPLRLLFVPLFLVPILRNGVVYVADFLIVVFTYADKAFFKFLFELYRITKPSSFDKTVEKITDVQSAQILNKESLMMAVAMLKNRIHSDPYYSHMSPIDRIKALERAKIEPTQDGKVATVPYPVSDSVIFGCFGLILSSVFAINAEIWALPILLMEHMSVIHHALVGAFDRLVGIKDAVGGLYRAFARG